MIDKPIPTPYKFDSTVPAIPQGMLDNILGLIRQFGYEDVFIAVHGRDKDGQCHWNGSSSIQSECLKNYMKSIAHRMEHENGENDVDK